MRTASFGSWVREARGALDLTQEALAERVSCAVQTIRKIEAGERRPSQQMAQRLAEALELPPAEHAPFVKAARAEVAQPSVAPVAAPPAPPPRFNSALPAMHTRFIGREAELDEVRRLLADPSYRLVTLVGPGGIGKTRLALEAAMAWCPFIDGVIFVPLAPISTAALLAPTIADAIGFTFSGPESPTNQLLRHLRAKELLLILDNLEHLLGDGMLAPPDGINSAAHLLARILTETPGVKLLITSRERVNLQGEWAIQLAGLPVGQADAPADARDADAVVLFAERTRQAQHDFTLTAANRDVVMRICRLLEGMPLGIELAATWARVLACTEIVAELERGLDFLQASTRDLPARHRSMRAVFEHSWQLLQAEEQRVLRRLAVFRGGFTRTAAEQVAGATLPVLAALVDKSLAHRVGAERYDLHEVVRQFAAAHLERDPEDYAATQDRHAAYYSAFFGERERLLKSALHCETFAELTAEIDNQRAAWHWVALRRRIADIHKAIPTLHYFYEIRGAYEEAVAIFRQAAEAIEGALRAPDATGTRPSEDEQLLLGDLLALQSHHSWRHGQFDQATDLLQRSLALLGSESPRAALSEALPALWALRPGRGDYAEARQLLRQRVELRRAAGHQWEVAGYLMHLCILTRFQGNHIEAYHIMHESLAQIRMNGDPLLTARILGYASAATYEIDALEEAQRLAEECIIQSSEIRDRFAKGLALQSLGLVAHARAQYRDAHSWLEESLTLFQELRDRWSMAHVLSSLGYTQHALGESRGAWQTFLAALEISMEAKTRRIVLDAVLGLATLLHEQEQTEQAAELCLHVLRLPGGSERAKDRAEQLWSDLKASLSQEQLVVLQERVQAQSLELLVAELLAQSKTEEMQPRRVIHNRHE